MESRAKRAKRISAATPTLTPHTTKQSDPSPNDNPNADSNSISGFRLTSTSVIPVPSLKLVWLHEWWLTRVESNGLGVAGFENRGRIGIRTFSSGAIVKRVDSTTLQTADGITIRLSGLIDRNRTHNNGFPFQVCHHFLFGFPYHWEDYALRPCSSKPMSLDSSKLFDDLPVSRVRDHLMSPLGGCEKNILNHLLATLDSIKKSTSTSPSTTVRHESHEKAKPPARGVATRSMTRLKSLSKTSE